ncbi:MAG: flagellar hook-associated protein FlgK [Verrucomicrobia bacterium]|nr:flagellar hook-associated protein FlgK [Verrucomicrobiota bacterium]
MLGLFGTLGLAQRSLSTQQQGVEVAGHNLANVSNSDYTRQRIIVQTGQTVPSTIGPQGTGSVVVGIAQLRSALVDRQIQDETSVGGFLDAQQQALQYAQANLGQEIDTTGSGSTSTSGQSGLAQGLSDLFNAFQSLSTDPTSLAERQVVLMKSLSLTQQFNQTSQRLDTLRTSLSDSVESDASSINTILSEIAKLNDQIINTETGNIGSANDLRDSRQSKLNELAELVKIDTVEQDNGAVNISIGGVLMVSDKTVLDQIETYDAGGGQILVRSQSTGLAITPTSGQLAGTIDARDGALASLQADLDLLATQLISEVNAIHATGYNLNGTNGTAFLTGTDAGDITVNATLLNDPSLIQASGASNAVGDNTTALALAQLANTSFASLGNQTFSERYNQTVAQLGQELSSTNSQITNQETVMKALQQQRDSVSGVSLDEEMTDLMKYQRAYEASARLISVLDSMLETVVNLKR